MVDSELVDSESLKVESFESFYKSVWDQVYRAVAVGIGDADVASESVDEATVRAYERWTKVSMMDNLEGWVYRTAMNWARSRLRRRKFRSDSQLPDMPLDDPDGADPRLIESIRHLPFHQREVVVARYLLDMSEQQTEAHSFLSKEFFDAERQLRYEREVATWSKRARPTPRL